MNTYPLKALVHGDAGAGKSWLGADTPGPRLILDAEGGSQFARQVQDDGSTLIPPSRTWDPMTEQPPMDLDPNESVFVRVFSVDQVEQAYAWLASGQHAFNSVVLDSLTDIQLSVRYRIRDGQAKQQEVTDERSWGVLLDQMIELWRKFRDLTDNPARPLTCVLILSGSELKDGQWVPQVQGGLRGRLAGYFDLVMFLSPEQDVITKAVTRKGHIAKSPGWIAKDRAHFLTEAYGPTIENPNIRHIMAAINAGATA